ncbi:MAG: hypothetical protein KF901_32560, partial [Myxococcales bacterium]|nr:hypothetical protein [Myxococcales bacterium]
VSVTVDGRSRRFDFVDVDVAARESHEVKLGRQLRPHDREQFIDMATAVRDGQPVRVGDQTIVLTRHKVALLHPDAARAEWSWILENAEEYTAVDFVLFAEGGRRHTLSILTLDAWNINGLEFASFDDWIAAGAPGAL